MSVTQRHCGYTLLELTVVMAIVGIIMGLATPRLVKMYDAVAFSLGKDDVLMQLSGLSYQVRQLGRDITLAEIMSEKQKQLLDLPEGWSLSDSAEDIHYSLYGYCEGGTIAFYYGNRQLDVYLAPPFCSPKIVQ